MGATTVAYATVVEGSIASVQFSIPQTVINESAGETEYVDDENGNKVYYNYYDWELYNPYNKDFSVTVYYKDGSTRRYSYDSNYGEFKDENGNYVYFQTNVINNQYPNHWYAGSNNCYYICHGGFMQAVPVTIICNVHNFGSNNPNCVVCGVSNPNYVAPAPVTEPAPAPAPATEPAAPPAPAPVVEQTPAAPTTAAAKTAKPKKTSISKLKAGKKSFKATWKKISGVSGYQIQYSTNNKFKKSKTVTVKKAKTTSATVKKLSAKKKYFVRVRTYKIVKVNGKSKKVYSGWSKVKTVTTKK